MINFSITMSYSIFHLKIQQTCLDLSPSSCNLSPFFYSLLPLKTKLTCFLYFLSFPGLLTLPWAHCSMAFISKHSTERLCSSSLSDFHIAGLRIKHSQLSSYLTYHLCSDMAEFLFLTSLSTLGLQDMALSHLPPCSFHLLTFKHWSALGLHL